MSAFVVLLIGIVFIVTAIAVLKIHPFFALILAAVLVGCLSPVELPGPEHLPQATRALSETARAFGGLAGKIAIVIVLAAVIGQALMESGAADKITRRLLAVLGEKRSQHALLGSGYLLSVPVFFDTVFFLLVPLARALRLRTGRNYMGYILAICAGAAITHSMVPPTPGPLIMIENLDLEGLDLGTAIIGGFLLGLPVSFAGGILLPRYLKRKIDPPMRNAPGMSEDELRKIVDKPESELPGFWVSLAPVILPLVLITSHSILGALEKVKGQSVAYYETLHAMLPVTSFLGDKLFALGLGTAIALWVLARQKGYSTRSLMSSLEPALLSAGLIILITCAGGAFGAMLRSTGLGDEIRALLEGRESAGWILLLISWIVGAILKIAQGSGTVAIVTASAIMGGVLQGDITLPYHPIYIYAAIAYGSKVTSWMNDSGFWVVSKMSGFTQEETLKTWTVLLTFMGIIGLIEVLILATLLPLV